MYKNFLVKLCLLSILLVSQFWLTGCNSGDSVDVTHSVAQPTGTLTGKLMDNSTRQPLGGVTVAVIVNGAKQTAVTGNSADVDLKGIFTFTGLPAGTHTFKAQVDGYAAVEMPFTIDQSADNTPVTTNLGQIVLSKAFTLTVVVTSDGIPVQGVTVVAYPEVTGITSGITDASGHVAISGLDQSAQYSIVAPPADIDGDGVYDYQAAAVSYDGATNSDKTISLPMSKAQRGDQIALAFDSLGKHGSPYIMLTERNISSLSGGGRRLRTSLSRSPRRMSLFTLFSIIR